MRDPRSQSGAASRLRRVPLPCALAALLVLLLRSFAAAEEPPGPERAGPETWGTDTSIGRLDYRAGRGLRFGDTKLTIGGFAVAEADALEGGGSRGAIEGLNSGSVRVLFHLD